MIWLAKVSERAPELSRLEAGSAAIAAGKVIADMTLSVPWLRFERVACYYFLQKTRLLSGVHVFCGKTIVPERGGFSTSFWVCSPILWLWEESL